MSSPFLRTIAASSVSWAFLFFWESFSGQFRVRDNWMGDAFSHMTSFVFFFVIFLLYPMMYLPWSSGRRALAKRGFPPFLLALMYPITAFLAFWVFLFFAFSHDSSLQEQLWPIGDGSVDHDIWGLVWPAVLTWWCYFTLMDSVP